ncbi:Ubiquitin conjugation factor E4 [Coemansia spiralis]|nr:Ubiquitin conjugation factor E4 [Coemansia spiralis]
MATLERALVARLDEAAVAACGTGGFAYLVGCWQTAHTVASNLCGPKGQALGAAVRETRVGALRAAQALLVSYMGLALQLPDMFPQGGRTGQAVVADALMADDGTNALAAVLPDLLDQIAARFADDGLPETMAPIVGELSLRSLLRANHSLLQPGFRRVFAALDMLTANRQIAQALPHMATFDPAECSGRRMQTGTALGPIMALSGFPGSDEAITKVYYADAPQRSRQDCESLHTGLRTTVQFLQTAQFEIVSRLVRAGSAERALVLQATLRTLATNALRSGMQVDMTRVVDDGFADNLAAVWLRLSEPFATDPTLQRIDRIDPDWVALRAMRSADAGGLGDEQGHITTYWRELTRINADQELVTTHLDQLAQEPASGAASSFVADCFFATAAALHLGPIATTARYVDLLKQIARFKKQIDQVQAAPELLTPVQRAGLPAVVQRWNDQLQAMERERCALDAQVLDPRRLAGMMVFYRLVMCFLLRQIESGKAFPRGPFVMPVEGGDGDGAPSDRWNMLPEFLIEDTVEFFVFCAVHAPDTLVDTAAQVGRGGDGGLRTFDDVLPLFVAVFLARPKYIRNPYIKAKLVDILHMLTYRDAREDDDYVDTLGGNMPGNLRLHPCISQFQASLDGNALARAYLVPALLRFYVDVEKTGASSQFYDKFNIRYYIARTLRALWARGPRYVQATRQFFLAATKGATDSPAAATTTGSAARDQRVVEEFVARLMTDTTYLLDESLSKLAVIRDIEKRQSAGSPPPPPPAEEGEEGDDTRRLQEAERMAQSYVSLAHETVHMLAFLSQLVPRPFQASEVVIRLAAMLNYNLVQLAGPKCASLRVADMQQRFSFNPRVLLSELTSVYIHLGLTSSQQQAPDDGVRRFVAAVAEDDRSYSPELFDKAFGILERWSLKSAESLARLQEFAQQCVGAKVDSRLVEYLEQNAPEEYLDPLLATLIADPVRLPTSGNVMDLAAIKGQLLSDPRDPFNRAPLTVDMLEPLPELKQEIAQWREAKTIEYGRRPAA